MAWTVRSAWALAVLLPLLGCGGGAGPDPSGSPEPAPEFLVPSTPVGGVVLLPDGPARAALAKIRTALGAADVAPDGSFRDLAVPSAPGLGGILGTLSSLSGDGIAPIWIEPGDLLLDHEDIALALVRLSSVGLSMSGLEQREFETCARATQPFGELRDAVLQALRTQVSLWPVPQADFMRMASAAAEDAIGCMRNARGSAKQGRATTVGPDACTPRVEFDEVGVQSRPVEGASCEARALNATMVFYELEVTVPGSLTTSFLLRPRTRAFAFPGLQAPEPPTETRLDLPAGDYQATVWKGLTAGDDPYAPTVRDSPSGQAFWANLAYGVCLLLDLKVKIVSIATRDPLVGIAAELIGYLLANPAHITVLVTQLTGSNQQVDAVREFRRTFCEGLVAAERLMDVLLGLVEHYATSLATLLRVAQQAATGAAPLVVSSEFLKKLSSQLGKGLTFLGMAQQHVPFVIDLLTTRVRLDFDFSIHGAASGQGVATSGMEGPPRLQVVWSPPICNRGDWVQFDATGSGPLVPADGPLTVRWDLDDDGVFERQGDMSGFGFARRQYFVEGSQEFVVEVADRAGRTTRARRLVFVRDQAAVTGFEAARVTPLAAAPGRVAVGDLDGDGDLDAIAALPAPGQLEVLEHTPSDGLVPLRRLDTTVPPAALALGDVDGDGDLDVVASSLSGPTLVLFRNDGALTFTRQADVTLAVSTLVPRAQFVDLDGNAFADLVFVDPNHALLHVWKGDGTFAFGGAGSALRATHAVGAQPVDVLAEDLDLDGDLDLVTANFSGDTLTVLEGDAAGAFVVRQAGLPAGAAVYGGPEHLAAGDLIATAGVELAVANTRAGTISVFRRDASSATLLLEAVGPDWLVGEEFGRIQVADFDEDGRADLARVGRLASAVSVTFLDGTWSAPGAQPRVLVDVDYGPLDLVAADLNGDGSADLLTADGSTQSVTAALGTGTRRFGVRRDLLTRDDLVSDEPYDAAVARLYEANFEPGTPRSGVGLDLAVITRLTSRLVLFRNRDGAGDLTREQTLDTLGEPLSVAVGDLDGDAALEIVVACNDGNVVSLYDRGADGRYALVEHVAAGNEPLRIAIANVDGLGLPEVVLMNYSPSSVSVWRMVPGGSPALELVPGSLNGGVGLPHGLALGALDDDAPADFVASNYFAGSLSLGFGRADGTFDVGALGLTGLTTPIAVALGRLDGPADAFTDVVATCGEGIAVYPGTGPRTFGAASIVATPLVGTNQANHLRLSDVDRDGYADLLVQDSNEFGVGGVVNRPTLHVLHGDGARGFGRPAQYLTAPGPLSLTLGDLTGDGKDDAVLCCHHWDASSTARRVSILRQR